MKKNYSNVFLFLVMLFLQCGSPAQQENENKRTIDTLAVEALVEETPTSGPETTEPEYAAPIDLDEFTKHPFMGDYPYIKRILKEDSIAFTLIALDTIHSEQRIIEFDNSRIEFLDSDENYQAELGDLICSSDITSPKFRFNQDVKIGMTQEDFLTRSDLDESSLTRDDASGLHYYENKISWGEDEGHWKLIVWFNAGVLVRVQSEISPCYYDYGD